MTTHTTFLRLVGALLRTPYASMIWFRFKGYFSAWRSRRPCHDWMVSFHAPCVKGVREWRMKNPYWMSWHYAPLTVMRVRITSCWLLHLAITRACIACA